jgi:NAD(P)H-flavin reductase
LVVFDPEIDTHGQLPMILPGEFAGVVQNLEQISSSLYGLHLKLAQGMKFYPGQFIELGVPWMPREWRSYSIASPPSQTDEIELIIKRIERGLFSDNLDRLVSGMAVSLRGPFGASYLREGDAPVLMVAAGSGIAPLLSMIRHAGEVADPRPFTLFYGARVRADLPLAAIAAWKPHNFNSEVTLSAPTPNCQWNGATGRVTTLLQHSIRDASPYDAYLCGAPEMCDAAELLLSAKGINEGRIFADRFYATSAACGATIMPQAIG